MNVVWVALLFLSSGKKASELDQTVQQMFKIEQREQQRAGKKAGLVDEPDDPDAPKFECRAATGEVAKIRIDAGVKQIAIAYLGVGGVPRIKYNPKGTAWVSEKTRLFVLAHECAHHALSHLYTEMNPGKEQQADCWALATLQKRELITSDDVSDIQRDVAAIAKGDSTHLSGAQRANNLQWCPSDPSTLERPTKPGLPAHCCTKKGKLGPYPNLSAPAGVPCIGFGDDGALTEGKLCQ